MIFIVLLCLCRSICYCDAKNIFRIVFLRNGAFFKEAVWHHNLMQKYYTSPDVKGTVTQIKKATARWSLQHEKINFESVACLLIKVLELYTSEFEYLGINVSKKSGFILILCLFVDDTFSKIERDGKLFRKRCQNFIFRILSRWGYHLLWLV